MNRFFSTGFALAVLLLVGGIAVPAANAQGGELGKTLRRMEAHNNNITTLRAAVTMAKMNVQLNETDINVGTAIYAKRKGKDALVRIDWTKPKESLAVGDGEYTIFQENNKIAYKGSVKGAQKNTKGASALAFMNMTKAQLEANYDAQYIGQGTLSDGTQTVHLKLTPKVKSSYKLAELWVDVDGMPRQTRILETNNDTTTVLLSKIEKNPSLTSSNFKIDLPSGTKITKS